MVDFVRPLVARMFFQVVFASISNWSRQVFSLLNFYALLVNSRYVHGNITSRSFETLIAAGNFLLGKWRIISQKKVPTEKYQRGSWGVVRLTNKARKWAKEDRKRGHQRKKGWEKERGDTNKGNNTAADQAIAHLTFNYLTRFWVQKTSLAVCAVSLTRKLRVPKLERESFRSFCDFALIRHRYINTLLKFIKLNYKY